MRPIFRNGRKLMSGTELNIDDVLAIKMEEDGGKITIERRYGWADIHFYFESNKEAAQLRIYESFGRSTSVVIFNGDTLVVPAIDGIYQFPVTITNDSYYCNIQRQKNPGKLFSIFQWLFQWPVKGKLVSIPK